MNGAPAHRGAVVIGGRCRAPGCYACHYFAHRARPLAELEQELTGLASRRPRVGIAWNGSNYFRALVRARDDIRGTL